MIKPITEDEFPEHIKTISAEQWKDLFSLLSEIKNTKEFGKIEPPTEISEGTFTFPYYNRAEIVDKFSTKVYEMGLIIYFDWMLWEDGSRILSNSADGFHECDLLTLCKLLTTIIRSDRFNDGFLVINFSDGTIMRILEAMKERVGGSI